MQKSTAVEQLWAWLFTHGRTTKVLEDGTKVGYSRQDVERAVNVLLGPIVDRIAVYYDWDFAVDEATESSVVGTHTYTLEGNDDNCRDIINVRYGPGRGKVIRQMNVLQTDRREGESESGASDSGTVYGYTLWGRSDDGKPVIKLFDTPVESDTMTYRYRMADITLGMIPDSFGYIVRDFLRAEFDPGFEDNAERALREMADRYKVGGDEYDMARKDPVIEAGNVRRGGLQGGM